MELRGWIGIIRGVQMGFNNAPVPPFESRLAFLFCMRKGCDTAIPTAVYTTIEPRCCPKCGGPLTEGFTTYESDKEINFYLARSSDRCEESEIPKHSKSDTYGFLSNFYICSQIVDGVEYKTNEHYYQSQKSALPDLYSWICNAPTPYLAMIAGRALRDNKGEVTKDWDKRKAAVMLHGLRAKFKNPELAKKLIDTDYAILHEDSPTDMYWGKLGLDMLGKLLMVVRREIDPKR